MVGLKLDTTCQAKLAAALALVVRAAAPALAVPVGPADEPAPVFRP